jgi:hypothetical protein
MPATPSASASVSESKKLSVGSAGQEQTKFRGCDRVGWAFSFAATAYNLIAAAEAVGGVGASAPANSQLNRCSRIVEADICDRDHLATCAHWR